MFVLSLNLCSLLLWLLLFSLTVRLRRSLSLQDVAVIKSFLHCVFSWIIWPRTYFNPSSAKDGNCFSILLGV